MGKLEADLKKENAIVYAISNEEASSLTKMKDAEHLGDSFVFLSDKEMKAADKYMGHYPDGSAVKPGTFVIDKSGKIVFSYVDENYAVRAAANDVLEAVKKANR